MNPILLNLIHFVIALLFSLLFLVGAATILSYLDRKVMALMQDRLGPLHNGPQGLLQAPFDVAKLLLKEDIYAGKAKDTLVYRLAPVIVFAPVLTAFVVLPFSPYLTLSALGTVSDAFTRVTQIIPLEGTPDGIRTRDLHLERVMS